MAYSYANLLAPKNVTSGIADFLVLAPVRDFDVDGIKCPEAPFPAPGDEVKVKTAHTFLAGKSFKKFACAPQKNQLSAKTIGDLGFQKLDFEAKFFIPGSYAEAHEAVKNLMNEPLIAMVRDSECAEEMWYQLGCDCVFAYAKFDFSTGTTKDGIKGYDATITYQSGFVQLYTVVGGPQLVPVP